MSQGRRIVKFLILGLILLNNGVIIPLSSEGPKELKRISSYPSRDSDIFFRPIICLAILDNQIYGVDNLDNKIVKFNIVYPEIAYSSDIGRSGQGPGDLMHPMYLSIWLQKICIKDGGAFSFFEKNGRFISRFKIFEGNDVFVYRNGEIFWLNPNLNEGHLVDVYNEEGLRARSFGRKDLNVDTKGYPNPQKILSEAYSGTLLSDANALYYFNSRFGYFEVYSFNGQLIRKGSINDGFGDRGKEVPAFNSDIYIERTRTRKEWSNYPLPVVFERAFMYKNSIYFAGTRIMAKGESTIIDIKEFSLDTMKLNSEYLIKKDGVCRLDALAIIEHGDDRSFLLSVTNHGEGYFLELYHE